MNPIPQQLNLSPIEVAEVHDLRSAFMEWMIQETPDNIGVINLVKPPRILIQFWDDAACIPADVQGCLDSWAPLEEIGFERLLFDDATAEQFILENFSPRHARAFNRCRHPAMRADFFRLCFVLKNGGLYVDADDTYQGYDIDKLMVDGRLKLQPLCYDIASDSMVDPVGSAGISVAGGRIFYVNNNPLLAPANHPIIAMALEQATNSLLSADEDSRDIQSLTGPGNLTSSLVAHAVELTQAGKGWDFELLTDWDSVAVSTWPLSYRSDDRNWRRWVSSDG
ncbi:glycosyltransferase family 32 protein [Pseudarthrobacter siccitolerans]|nr:glycosyltransferase [Pseudarthrobacter siccitolerans]